MYINFVSPWVRHRCASKMESKRYDEGRNTNKEIINNKLLQISRKKNTNAKYHLFREMNQKKQ